MKKGIAIIFILTGLACNDLKDPAKIVENIFYKVNEYNYESMSIPDFFGQLVSNHKKDYHQFSSNEFDNLCDGLNIDKTNEENKHNYYQIKMLHDLFTSKSADNCSVGDIWKIPYQWHWVNDNPRHKIYLKEKNELLKNIPPEKGFRNYNSYADIDRTPYLFLKELFERKSKYYSKECGDFSTFGWCSEREMAFISLLTILKFKGKVKAEGGHSWSEIILAMKMKTGKKNKFKVIVDNTFDRIEITPISSSEITRWEANMGDSKNKKWYNKKALSKLEQEKISNFIIPSEVMNKLEKRLVQYLNKKI